MPSLSTAVRAVRELGLRPTFLYSLYQLGLRSGWIKQRTPAVSWEYAYRWYDRGLLPGTESVPIGSGVFDSPPAGPGLPGRGKAAVEQAEKVLSGEFIFFGQENEIQMGFPPSWNRQPAFDSFPDRELSAGSLHWTRVSTGSVFDIKYVWELSRFSWVFILGRAYAATADPRWYEGFLNLLDSWCAQNQPNAGPQWISGQEVAMRLLAVVYAMDAFSAELERRPEQARRLRAFLAVHAARLPVTLPYARAQGNNHLISEALGLYAAGAVLTEHRESGRWITLGRRWLVRAVEEQVFPDGGYVQHSHTYARLALQEGLLGMVLAERKGEPLPVRTVDALKRLADLLGSMADPRTGKVPNFGSNDGALILPLTEQPIQDFRPTLQAASLLLDRRRLYPPGPWDELALWMGVGDMLSGSEVQEPDIKKPVSSDEEFSDPSVTCSSSFPDAGLYVLGNTESRAVLRCAHFQNRPNHSDQLHLDLIWQGVPLAVDAGTYLYNAPAPWQNSLVEAAVHNTVTINEKDPMRRAGRFLLLDWAQGKILHRVQSEDDRFEFITGQHDGYRRMGLLHRRTVVRVEGAHWIVVDDILAAGPSRNNQASYEARLAWLLPDYPLTLEDKATGCGLQMDTPRGLVELDFSVEKGIQDPEHSGTREEISIYRCGEPVHGLQTKVSHSAWGWVSPTYGEKQPANLVTLVHTDAAPIRFVTRWTPGGGDPDVRVKLRRPGESGCVLRTLRYGGVAWDPGMREKGGSA